MRPETPEGWHAVDAACAAVTAFPPSNQVTASAWSIVAALSALREESKDTPEGYTAFNRTYVMGGSVRRQLARYAYEGVSSAYSRSAGQVPHNGVPSGIRWPLEGGD